MGAEMENIYYSFAGRDGKKEHYLSALDRDHKSMLFRGALSFNVSPQSHHTSLLHANISQKECIDEMKGK